MSQSEQAQDEFDDWDIPMNEDPDRRMLDYYEKSAGRLPRFLFRGFHRPNRGTVAGCVPWDHQVNPQQDIPLTIESYTPNDFMWRARCHSRESRDIEGGPRVPLSRFTSWAANFESAVYFALGQSWPGAVDNWRFYEDGEFIVGKPENELPAWIAIVDSHTIANRALRVFHMPYTGLGAEAAPVEYLIHGPVLKADGVDFRVVDIAMIRTALGCQRWPRCRARARVPHPIGEEDVREAALVANLFRLRPGDPDEDQAVPLAVLAAELSRQQWPSPGPDLAPYANEEKIVVSWIGLRKNSAGEEELGPDVTTIMQHIGKYMYPLTSQNPAAPVTNPETTFLGSPQLLLMVDLGLVLRAESAGLARLRAEEAEQLHLHVEIRDPTQNRSLLHACNGPTRHQIFELGPPPGQLSLWFDRMTGGYYDPNNPNFRVPATDFSTIPNMKDYVIRKAW